MRERMKKKKNMIIGGLLAVVFLMSVGYAAFASNLSIEGTANTSSWIIKITNIQEKTKTSGVTNRETSYTDLTANFNCELTLPGDSITYEVTVENQGNIDAALKKVTKTYTNNRYIQVTYSGLYEGQMLYKQGSGNNTAVMEVTVTFLDKDYEGTFTNVITSNINISLDFEQEGNNVDTIKKYLVTYDSQDGTLVESRYVTWDERNLGVDATRIGYDLVGWYSQPNGSGTRAMAGTPASEYMESEDYEGFTLYASWRAKEYKVIFDNQGGNTVSASGNKFSWNASSLTGYTAKRTGFIKDTYYTQPNGQGMKIESSTKVGDIIKYLYGDGVDILASQSEENGSGLITIYMNWIPRQYTVNFDLQNGSDITGTQVVTWISTLTLPETPVKEGYTFDGWWTKASGGKQVTSETKTSKLGILDNRTTPITIYAHWIENE